ncbi:hypothetical protein TB2_031198 [Malus domestica]
MVLRVQVDEDECGGETYVAIQFVNAPPPSSVLGPLNGRAVQMAAVHQSVTGLQAAREGGEHACGGQRGELFEREGAHGGQQKSKKEKKKKRKSDKP